MKHVSFRMQTAMDRREAAVDDREAFREEVRAWLAARCPPSMRTPSRGPEDDVWGGRDAVFPSEDARLWLRKMAEKGWTAPTWPRAYGGAGLDAASARALEEELSRFGCRTALKSLGLWMLGPVLLAHGTEAQKREHLPAIARGETRWCQGYSEPSAGSDLASLRTRAERDGDAYVVNGQKIWTSHADRADWIFCLVRTGVSAPKHEGITFLLIDMRSPGVSTRPIALISGSSPFCETFFEGVRVPASNVVGREGGGWAIAKSLLEHERALISKMRDASSKEEEPLEALAARNGALADPILRDRIIQANLDFLCNKLTLSRAAEARERGESAGAETSMLKLYGTELNKRRRELRVVVLGVQGLGWEGEGFAPDELQETRDWLRSRGSSIEGGTSEVQLNIIAKRVLGLPD